MAKTGSERRPRDGAVDKGEARTEVISCECGKRYRAPSGIRRFRCKACGETIERQPKIAPKPRASLPLSLPWIIACAVLFLVVVGVGTYLLTRRSAPSDTAIADAADAPSAGVSAPTTPAASPAPLVEPTPPSAPTAPPADPSRKEALIAANIWIESCGRADARALLSQVDLDTATRYRDSVVLMVLRLKAESVFWSSLGDMRVLDCKVEGGKAVASIAPPFGDQIFYTLSMRNGDGRWVIHLTDGDFLLGTPSTFLTDNATQGAHPSVVPEDAFASPKAAWEGWRIATIEGDGEACWRLIDSKSQDLLVNSFAASNPKATHDETLLAVKQALRRNGVAIANQMKKAKLVSVSRQGDTAARLQIEVDGQVSSWWAVQSDRQWRMSFVKG